MGITQGFLDKLDKIMELSSEPCTCEEKGSICQGCAARAEIDSLYMYLESAIERIEKI